MTVVVVTNLGAHKLCFFIFYIIMTNMALVYPEGNLKVAVRNTLKRYNKSKFTFLLFFSILGIFK